MSDTKFTPGPWTAIHSSWETSLVNGHPSYGYTVAVCPIHCDVSEDDQAEYESVKDANAHLIAAAPEMYDELLRCMTILEDSVEGRAAFRRIKKVLNKAGGES